jgi:hypothetical protein
MVNQLRLRIIQSTLVKYFQPECSNGLAIETEKIYYTYVDGANQAALYSLSPDEYSDARGYYLSWERCCRNYSITNIYSQNPDVGGIYAGQTFYLEFPPLKKNGKSFINSSPRLFPPLSDYACPGSLYYVDFAGTDPDGDSLVYSLATPLNTKSGDALPPPFPPGVPRPGPYPSILWRAPFGPDNIMNGSPDLQISKDGLLTVVPQSQGLYVFSVRCQEFRDRVRIGEVRRDFQMLVLAECQTPHDPVIEVKKPTDTQYTKNHLSVSYPNNVSDNDRCVDVRVSDPDAPADGIVKVRAIPIGFKNKDLNKDIIPEISSAVISPGGFASFSICFPQCPYIIGPYQVGIIAGNNVCPLPRLDTVIITVNIEPPFNNKPSFQNFPADATILEGSPSPTFTMNGNDIDLDSMTMTIVPVGFKLEDYGFQYDTIVNEAGEIRTKLTWDTRCDVVDFSAKTDFEFKFLLNDKDQCDLLPPEEKIFKLHMDLYDFHSPTIEYVPDPGLQEVILTKKMYEQLTFKILGTDEDEDVLVLKVSGNEFNLSDYNISFPTQSGNSPIESTFNWFIDCNTVDLNNKSEFDFQFIVVDDKNRCNYYLADTLNVKVMVEPPDNTAPRLEVLDRNNGLSAVTDKVSIFLDQEINLDLKGLDPDIPSDKLKIFILSAQGLVNPDGYKFTTTPEARSANFLWQADCSIFKNGKFENDYTFLFVITDDRCFNVKGDTIKVEMTIRDKDNESVAFMPPNFITPNDDGVNDFFAMVKEDPSSKTLVSILPKDNCAGRFISIRIYNRYGKEIYLSEDRDFRWYAKDANAGVYFYTLFYSDKDYKGTITVRR